ncbi:hypothetical protein [Leptospira ryugenii]|nr:hypothetical protein [Leptospira ryugenii]
MVGSFLWKQLGPGLTIQGDVMLNLFTKDKSLGNKHTAGDLLDHHIGIS